MIGLHFNTVLCTKISKFSRSVFDKNSLNFFAQGLWKKVISTGKEYEGLVHTGETIIPFNAAVMGSLYICTNFGFQ